jgi:hypothetical protein
MPNDYAEIIGKFFGEYPDLKKVYVNNTEAEIINWKDTLVVFRLPEEPTGNIIVKLVSSGGESNEFPYFCGLPVNYLNSCESILVSAEFYVEYYNEKASRDYSRAIGTRPQEFNKSNFNWNNNVLSVDLSSIENITGTIIYTFAENGIELENVEVDYTRSEAFPSEVVHYTGINFPHYQTIDSYSGETSAYYFGSCGEALEQNTTAISGSLNYVDELRADIDGIKYSAGCAFNSIQLELEFAN